MNLTVVARVFVCYEQPALHKVSTLRVSPDVDCFSSEWFSLIPWACLGILNMIGLPAFILWVFCRAQQSAKIHQFRFRYGWLMYNYL